MHLQLERGIQAIFITQGCSLICKCVSMKAVIIGFKVSPMKQCVKGFMGIKEDAGQNGPTAWMTFCYLGKPRVTVPSLTLPFNPMPFNPLPVKS